MRVKKSQRSKRNPSHSGQGGLCLEPNPTGPVLRPILLGMGPLRPRRVARRETAVSVPDRFCPSSDVAGCELVARATPEDPEEYDVRQSARMDQHR